MSLALSFHSPNQSHIRDLLMVIHTRNKYLARDINFAVFNLKNKKNVRQNLLLFLISTCDSSLQIVLNGIQVNENANSLTLTLKEERSFETVFQSFVFTIVLSNKTKTSVLRQES